jgi:Family of unknown function (DUF6338)
MPDSIVGLIIAVAMILPGFVIVELSLVGRPRGQQNDVELVLRALFYALFLHLLASPWTAWLVGDVGPVDDWHDHVLPLAIYVAVVLVIAPVVIGSLLGAYLRQVEREEDRPGFWYSALGARDAGSAWDNVFQRLARTGAWVIIELTDGKLRGGSIGKASAIGQTPSPHDLFVEEIWTTETDGDGVVNLDKRVEPIQGIWVAEAEIRSVTIIDPPYAKTGGKSD